MVDPLKELQRFCAGKTQTAAARELGVSRAYLVDALAGRRAVGDKLLTALGIEKTVEYSKP